MPGDFTEQIEAALAGAGPVAKADYLRWTREGDLPSRARAYALSAAAWARIAPEPTMEEQCAFMAAYLLECLVDDPPSDGFVHTGLDAGYTLAAWLRHLAELDGTDSVIRRVAADLGDAFSMAHDTTRTRIETAALEHALESPRLRPYFEDWAADPVRAAVHSRALAWGLAHEEGPDDG